MHFLRISLSMSFYLSLLLATLLLTTVYVTSALHSDDQQQQQQHEEYYHQQQQEDITPSRRRVRYNGSRKQMQQQQRMEYNSDAMLANSAEDTMHDIQPYDFFSCCNQTFGSCRTACENLNLAQYGNLDNSGRSFRLDLKKHCPSMQLEFWSCMNETLAAVNHGIHWSGRRCCTLGISPRCRNACATSSSSEKLSNACRRSDEQRMFACFKRQEAGDRCCNAARNPECLQACNGLFDPKTAQRQSSLQALDEKCGKRNADVLECVRNATDIIPEAYAHKLLPCCDYAQLWSCRNTCRTLLNTTTEESMDLVIGELEQAGCGPPMPHLPLWQCFLTIERKTYVPAAASASASDSNKADERQSQINEIGIDAAKLHCCEKAQTQKCRRLCAQTYTNAWTTRISEFERECRALPDEWKLRQCLDDVDEPCTLGCDGLGYCTNFNNRPTELFRNCASETDAAARSDLKMWQQRGYVSLPGVDLPIKNMTRCAPEYWKAIACALQIKPCTRLGLYNHICREDCYDILSKCIDWARMNSTLHAGAICARLHPSEDGVELPCVSLKPYLEESDVPKDTGGHHGLTSLCKGHRCNATEVCVSNRRIVTAQQRPYQCVPGCSLGEGSNFWVPFGAFVRIPVINVANGRSLLGEGGGGAVSFKVCRCGMQGRIEHCQPLPNFSYEHCVGNYQHGKTFKLECNVCSCYAGETTCTKKQCRMPGFSDHAYTSLPCNCATHFVPVCGINGNTYQSACIARCLGLQDSELVYGPCSMLNPCQDQRNRCPVGQECFEQRKVCLSSMQRPCPQYQCVNQTTTCPKLLPANGGSYNSGGGVCDTNGRTHRSACELLNAHATLDYWGSCLPICGRRSAGAVCGINGVTYTSECAAWADYVLVDYRGRCREIGLLNHDMGKRCRTVICPRRPSPYCRLIVPPGACCPICGGAFRVIYSRKQIDRALYSLRGQFKDLLTLQHMLAALDALIDFKECQLTGFLSMEVGLFVAVVPRLSVPPTRTQIEACVREAEKISTLISTQSHLITTNLVLSGLTASFMINPHVESGSAGHVDVALVALVLLIVLGLLLTSLRRNCL